MESGRQSPGTQVTGGLIVMVRTNPAHAARVLAADLHAELVVGGAATEVALDRFAEPAPAAPRADLDELAASMRRAEMIREHTRTATAERLASSFNTRLAIHPDTIRRAAAEVVDARASDTATQRQVRRRARRFRWSTRLLALVAVAASVVVGIRIDALLGGAIGGGCVLLGGIALFGRWLYRRRRPKRDLLLPARARLELAERRWAQVTPAGSDPADVETLIHRYEPQHKVITALLSENLAVRAADRMAIERRAAWVAAWRAAVGDDAPLTDPDLASLLRSDETEIWLDTGGVPKPGPPTLVVADPFTELGDERAKQLHRRLMALPRDHRVIVVLEPDPDHPSGARLPALGRAEAFTGS